MTGAVTAPATAFDVNRIREDFPILQQKVYGNPLVYLDNAATSQKPQAVIDAITKYYTSQNSNIHRGAHYLSTEATNAYENSRTYIAEFINARESREINFVRGTTEAINLVANAYGKKFTKKDDEIIISALEHHSNIVPWQMVCEATGARLRVIPVNEKGEIIYEEFENLLSKKTKIVSIAHTSNSLGTINPIKDIIAQAHAFGAVVFIDGAQAVPHTAVDVQELDCDFFCFSGHKVFGPTGIGILYGKAELLEKMDPYMGGGEMISSVSFEKTTYNNLPFKFEAGTPNICGGIALHSALEYVSSIGYEAISAHENELLHHAQKSLQSIEGVKLVGTAANKASVASFVVEGVHHYDIGVLLDKMGIAIRTGHHCCQPLMQKLGIGGTCRASFAFYNTIEEVVVFGESLEKVLGMLR